MYYLIYNILLITFLPVIIILYLLRTFITKKEIRGLKQRLAMNLPQIETPTLWFHAVSVGEVMAIVPLIKELRKEYKDKIVLSTITDTGQEVAKRIKEVDTTFYLPLDLPFFIKKVINKIKPKILIIIETELWPNLLYFAKKNNCKTILLNGRISDKSYPRYREYQFFLKRVLKNFDFIYMQTEKDKERIISIGAAEDRVTVMGNIKLDIECKEITDDEKNELKQELNFNKDDIIFVAGSTHHNEEEIIIDIFDELKQKFNNLKLILAPRHIERTLQIENIIKKHNLSYCRKTELGYNYDILILDTIGELKQIYKVADVVFIGGSLVNIGGHNILEPLAFNKLTIFGKYMQNFKEIVELFKDSAATYQVKDKEELTAKICYILENKKELTKKLNNVKEIFNKNKGTINKSIELIKMLL